MRLLFSCLFVSMLVSRTAAAQSSDAVALSVPPASASPAPADPTDSAASSAPRLAGLTRIAIDLRLLEYGGVHAHKGTGSAHANVFGVGPFEALPHLEILHGVSEVVFVGFDVLAYYRRQTQSGFPDKKTGYVFFAPALEFIARPGARSRPFVRLTAGFEHANGTSTSSTTPTNSTTNGAALSGSLGVHFFVTRRFALSPALEIREFVTTVKDNSGTEHAKTTAALLTVRASFFAGRTRSRPAASPRRAPSVEPSYGTSTHRTSPSIEHGWRSPESPTIPAPPPATYDTSLAPPPTDGTPSAPPPPVDEVPSF